LLRHGQFSLFQSPLGDLANQSHRSSKQSTSPWLWQSQAKLTCLTWPVHDRVEEHFICCGNFAIFGGGFGLLLNFCMLLVEMNTWLLIVVHPIPSNICVLAASVSA